MSVASISLAPMLSTLFFLTISGLALTAMWLAVPLLWKRHAPLVVAGSVALVAFFLVLPAAQATDVVIINGAGCQVTEEDAIGIFLHNDLYLRIDFPDSHWRFGLVNQGMKGLALVDVGGGGDRNEDEGSALVRNCGALNLVGLLDESRLRAGNDGPGGVLNR